MKHDDSAVKYNKNSVYFNTLLGQINITGLHKKLN